MMANRRSVLCGIGTGTALLVSGNGVAGATRSETGTDDPDLARVRVLHASPDAPAVDVFVDGNAVLEDVTFKTISEYLAVPAATYDVAVAPAGSGVDTAVIETALTLEAGTDYTVAATNKLEHIEPTVFVDDNDAVAPQSRRGRPTTQLRVRHLSPDAPAVDIAQTGGPGVGSDSMTVAKELSYQTATDALDLKPGKYQFEIRAAGTDQGVFEFAFDPQVGGTYTAYAVGLLEPETDAQAFDVISSVDVAPLPDRAGTQVGTGREKHKSGKPDAPGTGNGRQKGRGNGR